MLTFKELKLQTNNLTDFSNVKWLEVKPQHLRFFLQEQKNQWFIAKATEVHGSLNGYHLLNYIDTFTNVEVFCNKCQLPFWQNPYSHLMGYNCPTCSKIKSQLINESNRKTTEQFIKEAKLIHGDRYDYSKVIYINNDTKVEIICLQCNKSFWQKPTHHLFRGHGCPICSSSKNEKVIDKILIKNDITSYPQWHFNKHQNLRGKGNNYMAFDFYLPDYNLCIEYDGQQHYEEHYIGRFKITKEILLETQRKDMLKNQFCLDNDIRLLRIPYWVKPTDTLILQYLNGNFTVINASTSKNQGDTHNVN